MDSESLPIADRQLPIANLKLSKKSYTFPPE
jgi:hypothetical protein